MRASAFSIGVALLALGLLGTGVAPAAEVVVKNDSTVGGTGSTVANFFNSGERTASWLTAPCSGDVVAARVYWASMFGGAPASLETSITLFSQAVFPTPGPPLVNQGGGNAVIVGPMLVDGSMNEFRFLDPPADTIPLSVPVTAGLGFVVSFEFFNTNAGNDFAPSVTFDTDGCIPGVNTAFAIPGGWNDACLLGVTGDWVIRAVIDCQGTVPATGAWSRWLLVGLLLVAAPLAASGALSRARSA